MKEIEQVRAELDRHVDRSAWGMGVTDYAHGLLDNVEKAARAGHTLKTIQQWKKAMLNGASDWFGYSYGGYAFTRNEDIVNRLCTHSMIKRKRKGELSPNRRETWHDKQAQALYQAEERICGILHYKLGLPF